MTKMLSTIGTVASLLGAGANIVSDYVSEKKMRKEIEDMINERVKAEVAKQLVKH